MKQGICQNCNAQTHGDYCSDCGQKTDTHRITLKHFFLHDLLHGIWHLEKGILFTIKETFVRPGQAALDYIHGKRIRYYNVFYLALLIIGLNLLLSHFYENVNPVQEEQIDNTPQVSEFFRSNLKTILLSIVPLLGMVAFLIFRRLKLNLAEHFIMGGISLLGILMMSIVFGLVNFIETFDMPDWIGYLEIVVFFMMFLFPIWTYYNATKNLYSF
ncbi:DUF3667 domain-containing protein [Flavobacterium sp.]|uniref:DUF3667 domain-containing protein n=1 Tax=Flavobacterium sp. TaxID=239 RepID=UPI00261AD042|nr:DUF3667 domain-containing protein [Flavobacterium sp.]